MKKVLLLNAVHNGGATYTEYLKYVSLALPNDIDVVTYNVPSRTNLVAHQVEEIMNGPVTDIEAQDILQITGKQFPVIMTNEAGIGHLIDPDIWTVFIGHGSSAMPANSPYMHAEYLSYFDVVTVSSRSTQQMLVRGLPLYREHRGQGVIESRSGSVRADLRHTSIMPTLPIKIENRHMQPITKVPTKDFTIGLIPTASGAIQSKVSLYHNLNSIVKALLENFYRCRIIFRPYPTDLENPAVQELCDNFKNMDRVDVSSPEVLSSIFYQGCDLVITDASNGGASFLLRKAVPPVHFVPIAALENEVTRWFVDVVRYVPISHTIDDLVRKIGVIVNASQADLFEVYNAYMDNEMFLQKSQSEYIRDIINRKTDSENTIGIDAFGDFEILTPQALV